MNELNTETKQAVLQNEEVWFEFRDTWRLSGEMQIWILDISPEILFGV
jgi:hypothetical protein